MGRRLTIPPVLSEVFENFNHDAAFEHERMFRTLDDLDLTLVGSHGVFHPTDGMFGNLLVPVAVPHTDAVRVRMVRESHW